MRNKLTEITEGTPNQLPKNLYRKQLLKITMSFQNYQPAHIGSQLESSYEEHMINKKGNIKLKNDWP